MTADEKTEIIAAVVDVVADAVGQLRKETVGWVHALDAQDRALEQAIIRLVGSMVPAEQETPS